MNIERHKPVGNVQITNKYTSTKRKVRIVEQGLTFDGTLSEKQAQYATTYFRTVFPKKKANTLTSYDSDLIIYRNFCAANGYPMVSADIDIMRTTLMDYIDFLAERNRKTTISRRLNTIRILFKSCQLDNLFETDLILKEHKQETFGQLSGFESQANAFDENLLDDVNENFIAESMKDIRDLAMINVMFDGLLRNDEVRRMHLEHINQDTGALFIPDAKGDKKNEGTRRFLTRTSINMVLDWCHEAEIISGPIWRTISPKGTSITERTKHKYLSDQAVTDVIKRVIDDVKGVGFSKGFSSHSLRVGAAVTLFRNGMSIAEIAQAGGWASESMVLKYVREFMPNENGMAKWAKMRNR